MRQRNATPGGAAMRTAALVSALLLLAACAGGEEPAETADSGTTEAGSDATPEAQTTAGTTEATDGETTAPDGEATASSALEGETIEFVVPYDPGGGYDQYVRLAQPFLADCSGADVVVLNEPGAGGLLATNQTAIASPDSLRIQIINTIGAAGAQIAEAEGVQFDLTQLSWIARVAGEPNVFSVGASSPYQDVQSMVDAGQPIRFVATGPGSSEYIGATVLSQVYGFEAEIITGFAGSGEAIASIAAGDADAIVLSLDSSLPSIESGDLNPLALVAPEGTQNETVPDTGTVYDTEAADASQEEVLDAYVALVETARSVAGPPDMPEEQLSALREAMTCALEDEEFQTLAEQAGRPVSPLTGEEIAEVVATALDSPEAFQELVRESFSSE